MPEVIVIGAGLAGSEAAWQAANAGASVKLYEMRPAVMTPAHHTAACGELVCSNSLRAAAVENAVGLLKEEMRRMDSLIMKAADASRVPAGGALAVDRQSFSRYITDAIESHPNIRLRREEVAALPAGGPIVTASGPLTSPALSESLAALTGRAHLYFYDAAAPIVEAASLNYEKVYRASRYGKGTDDYLNCPMDRREYERFWQALVTAEKTELKAFEKTVFFEGCMPVEAMAARGVDTLRFGPLKPVGLERPDTGERPYAVVQLRQDNHAATLFNIVGFQTQLKWPEQKRVFGMIPGLERAEFVRFGVMHRNTFIDSPRFLAPTLQTRADGRLLFAGQITGVEGYVESAATGLVAGLNGARLARGEAPLVFPRETAHGALCHYITHCDSKHFQPMNVNFGLLPPLEDKIRDKKLKNKAISDRALEKLRVFKKNNIE